MYHIIGEYVRLLFGGPSKDCCLDHCAFPSSCYGRSAEPKVDFEGDRIVGNGTILKCLCPNVVISASSLTLNHLICLHNETYETWSSGLFELNMNVSKCQ